MVMLPVAVAAGLLAATSMAGPVPAPVEHNCATEDISHEIRSLWARQQYSQPDNGQDIELGAVFHFCCSSQSDCPTDDVAQNGVKVMNEFYAPAKLKFNLRNTTRINDPICSQTDVADSYTMDNLKAQSHQGGTDTLNIVYVPTNEGPGTKGVCIIPPPSNDIASSVGNKDGCVVATSTLPGQAKNGQGDPKDVTSVHEAGHWLGLQHTPETGGNGGFSRRQYGGTRNIMEPVQITGSGINYQFNQQQISSLRQIALMRKNQGNGETGPSPKYAGGSDSAAPVASAVPTVPAGNNNKVGAGNNNGGGNTTPTYTVPPSTRRRPIGGGSNGGVRHSRPANKGVQGAVAPAAPAAPAQPVADAPTPVTTVYTYVTVQPEAGGAASPAAPAQPAQPAQPAEAGAEQNGEDKEQQDSDEDCDENDDSQGEGNSSVGNGYEKRAMDSAEAATETKLIHIARRAFQIAASEALKQSPPLVHIARRNAVAV